MVAVLFGIKCKKKMLAKPNNAKKSASTIGKSLSVRSNIGFPVVRTDGRVVYGHVIAKFSGMGRFT